MTHPIEPEVERSRIWKWTGLFGSSGLLILYLTDSTHKPFRRMRPSSKVHFDDIP